MHITSLKKGVAAQVDNFDIKNFTANDALEIKELLLDNTILVLKKQATEPAYFTNFVQSIGEIANHNQFVFDPITGERICTEQKSFVDPLTWSDPSTYPVQRVTGKKVNGQISGIFGTGILDWHANLNGLTRADGVALQGYSDCEGTSTTWLNTVKVMNEMPVDLLQRCKDVYCEYEYAPDVWARGLPEKQKNSMLKNQSKYKMWLIQQNRKGRKGIYFYTNNKCKIITEDTSLYNDLFDFMFQNKYMYQHFYDIGDIVLSDQILSLHKRDQNEPDILAKRILHRITFRISNTGNPKWLVTQNQI